VTKLKHLLLLVLLITGCRAWSQNQFIVRYHLDSTTTALSLLTSKFPSAKAADAYVATVPALLRSRGFIAASIDSIAKVDTTSADVYIYVGEQYKWANIVTRPVDNDILTTLRWSDGRFNNTGFDFGEWQKWQQRILDYLEETGHPFGKVFLDSIQMNGPEVRALLVIDRGPIYQIDSIRVYGNVDISNQFLQQYLGIKNGSLYNKKKLVAISKKMSELAFVQEEKPSDITMLGSGSIVNLYLQPKKNNQVNGLLAFLPNSNGEEGKKFQLAGEANVLLRNALGAGETFGINWQQMQKSSPRLNVRYQHPYVWNSPFGIGFRFDMFRKDSSYVNIDMELGAEYGAGERQSASIFLLRRQSIVNTVNETQVIATKRLPDEGDVRSTNLGFGYEYNSTDYRMNPRSGNQFYLNTSAGSRKIKKNNQVLELTDQSDPSFRFERLYDTVKLKSYQFRLNAVGAHYFPLGKQSTVKTALDAGFFTSQRIFRNELFQIGGHRLLRGFNEESQYVSQYAVATTEYRYLFANSAFFVFVDGGWGKLLAESDRFYLGTGLGLSIETKAGIFNLAWAIGSRDDTEFNLRQSKIHFGFLNFF
jgi:outer membrane protein assembly factor BamA